MADRDGKRGEDGGDSALAAADTIQSDDPEAIRSLAPEMQDTVADTKPAPMATSFAPGSTIGRFTVVEALGQGGMGTVVAAYDPELDRKVAIKLLRPEAWGGGASSQGRERLLREARAMAKLSHPNVLTVFEAGTTDDRVFVAMEFAAGGTLTEWLRARTRTWREVLEVFVRAGQGLAAAHAAGLVHRDFKPDNVLLTKDGRVRVADFGLVGVGAHAREDDAVPGDDTPLGATLTMTGSLVGTPAYMAPEQHAREKVDETADQFAFCVALYEALYGERPFAGKTYWELALNVREGKLRDPPGDTKVPDWVFATIKRGLATRPDERYASLEPLLAALQGDPSAARRRRLALAGVGGLLAALTAVAAYGLMRSSGPESRLCRTGPQELASAWDEHARAALRRAFLATGRPYAEDTFDRVRQRLDAYGLEWVEMHTDACEATHVRGTQSEGLLDVRMQCLSRRLDSMGSLVRLLGAQADAEVLDRAVAAVSNLASLDACADPEALAASVPPPEDPEVRGRVEDLRKRFADAGAHKSTGQYREGLEIAAPAVEESRAIGYEPALAEGLVLLGQLQHNAGDGNGAEATLQEAMKVAAAAKDAYLVADASIELIAVVGDSLARHADALAMRPFAEAALTSAGDDDTLRARLLHGLGAVAYRQGKLDEAFGLYESSLSVREQALGADHPSVGASLVDLCSVLASQGKFKEARTYCERALPVLEKALGPDHPNVASCLNNLGNLHEIQGEYAEARELHERALTIRENALGAEHPQVAATLNNLGNVVSELGDDEEATRLYERALAIREKALGNEHPDLTYLLSNLGSLAYDHGRYDEARRYHERALAIRERASGPEHPEVAWSLSSLGNVLVSQGEYDEALAACRRALAINEKALGPNHPYVAYDLICLGRAYLGTLRPREAVEPLERAVKVSEQSEGEPIILAGSRFALARALWDAKGSRNRAIRLAEQARDWYAQEQARAVDLREVKAWLAERGVR